MKYLKPILFNNSTLNVMYEDILPHYVSDGLVLYYDSNKYTDETPNLAKFTDYSDKTYGIAYAAVKWGGDDASVYYYENGGFNDLPYKKMVKHANGSGGCFIAGHGPFQIENNKSYVISAYVKANREISIRPHLLGINRYADGVNRTQGTNFGLTRNWVKHKWVYLAGSDHEGLYQSRQTVYEDDASVPLEVYWCDFRVEENGNIIKDLSSSKNNAKVLGRPHLSDSELVFDGIQNQYLSYNEIYCPNEWSTNTWIKFNLRKDNFRQVIFGYMHTNPALEGGHFMELTPTGYVFHSVAVDASNNIYAGGAYEKYNNITRPFLIKLHSNGDVDESFNCNYVPNTAQRISDIKIDSSGRVYRNSYNLGSFVRLNSTGGVDRSLVTNSSISSGKFLLDEENGKIYLTGWFTTVNGKAAQRFAKINLEDFSLDESFDTSTGFVSNDLAQIIAKDSLGRIYIGGSFTSYQGNAVNRLIRVNSNGSLDTSFVLDGTGFNTGSVTALAIDSSNKIYAGGTFTSYNGIPTGRIVKLNDDGSIDSSLGGGFNSTVNKLMIDSQGKILACGNFTTFRGSVCGRITRINPDETLDEEFNHNLIISGVVNDMDIQTDGKIIAVGTFLTTYDTSAMKHFTTRNILRLNTDGTLDESFWAKDGITHGIHRINTRFYYRNLSGTITSDYIWFSGPGGIFNGERQPISLHENFWKDVWRNVTFTMKDNILRIYIDAQLYLTRDYSSLAQSTDLYVNRSSTMLSSLGVYQIYNKQLSPAEISRNFEAFRHRYRR